MSHRKRVFTLVVVLAVALAATLSAVTVLARRHQGDARAAPEPERGAAPDREPSALPATPLPVNAPLAKVTTPPPGAASSARPARAGTPPLDGGGRPGEEAVLMERLRGLESSDPPLTLSLAREGNARFPNSPDAPERAWMVVRSLVNMQRFSEAHDEAQTMVNRYPGTSWSQDVQRHLLSNPLQ